MSFEQQNRLFDSGDYEPLDQTELDEFDAGSKHEYSFEFLDDEMLSRVGEALDKTPIEKEILRDAVDSLDLIGQITYYTDSFNEGLMDHYWRLDKERLSKPFLIHCLSLLHSGLLDEETYIKTIQRRSNNIALKSNATILLKMVADPITPKDYLETVRVLLEINIEVLESRGYTLKINDSANGQQIVSWSRRWT